jgi:hypothetical protein
MSNEARVVHVTSLRKMHFVADPSRTAFDTIACIQVIWRGYHEMGRRLPPLLFGSPMRLPVVIGVKLLNPNTPQHPNGTEASQFRRCGSVIKRSE